MYSLDMFSLPAPFARNEISKPSPLTSSVSIIAGVLSSVFMRVSGSATDLRASAYASRTAASSAAKSPAQCASSPSLTIITA